MKEKLREADGVISRLKSRRWSVLLGLLISTYLLDSVVEESPFGEVLSRLLYMVVFAGAVLAAEVPGRTARLALLVIFCWPLVSILNVVWATEASGVADFLFVATILVGCLIIVFHELSRDEDAVADAVAGAMFGYLLIALVFALFYVKLEAMRPGSFNMSDMDGHTSSLVYFSLVTITTLGLGDITPVSRLARVVVGIEAATGMMYVAVFIGRLVARR